MKWSHLSGKESQALMCSGVLRETHPVADRVLRKLWERPAKPIHILDLNVRERNTWIRLKLSADSNVVVYESTGTVLIQGKLYENGSYGRLLAFVLAGEKLRWQAKF